MTYAHALFAEAVAQLRRPGTATYRFQLGPSRGFEHVAALSEYLDTLGVTDVYLSPCFKCAPGSTHGYDVTDHNAFNPEIGSPITFDRMTATLDERGMGVILDIVPNHMGVAGDTNPWWMDVLENGPSFPAPPSSTSSGHLRRPSYGTRCSCPCSRTSMGRSWRRDSSSSS